MGHLCFPIAFFGHFQYTHPDQERIPHSPSGGDFHGKGPWAARFALHPGMKITRQFCIFTKKRHEPNSLARIGVPTTSHKDVRASYVQQRSLTKGSQLSMEMSKFAHLRFQLGNDSRKRLHHHNLIFLMLHSVSVV